MTQPPTIALFTGDSITDAGRRTDPHGHLGAGYVRRISEMAEAAAAPLRVVNTGVGGDRTTELLARWSTDVIECRPDVLTVLVGVNDMWRRYDASTPTSPEEFEANYRLLLDRVRNELDLEQLVLMDPFVVPIRADQAHWFEEDLKAKVEIVNDLATQWEAVHIPLHELFTAKADESGPHSVVEDGVHPTPDGHDLIARAWWRSVGPRFA
ncbi:MAG: SGNH/GDSL hydrolase family protein [Leifsonia sp.]